VAVAGANESVPNLEPSGVGAADRVLNLFPVDSCPIVMAETDADDEVVQVGEPLVVQADAEPERVVPSTNATTKPLTGSLVSMTCGGSRSPGGGVTAAKRVYHREVAESFGGERTADTRLVPYSAPLSITARNQGPGFMLTCGNPWQYAGQDLVGGRESKSG